MAKEKKYKLSLPTSLDAIPLHQYQKYVKVINEHKDNVDEEFLRLKLLEIFCGLTMREAYELAAVDVDGIIEILVNVLNSESPLQRRFTMTDPKGIAVEFGFIPNLERISLGEFIDAEAYISDWDNMHKAMAVLYRPLTGHKGEFYEIEKYEGSDKYAAIMADAPASVAIGAMLFFLSFRDDIVSRYASLFSASSHDGFAGPASNQESFTKKWGWYQSIYALAGGDVFRISEVTGRDLHECLLWLEFEKEKSQLEAQMLKQYS